MNIKFTGDGGCFDAVILDEIRGKCVGKNLMKSDSFGSNKF